jgi:hypothetical protein
MRASGLQRLVRVVALLVIADLPGVIVVTRVVGQLG